MIQPASKIHNSLAQINEVQNENCNVFKHTIVDAAKKIDDIFCFNENYQMVDIPFNSQEGDYEIVSSKAHEQI